MSDVIRAALKSLANAEALSDQVLENCFADILAGDVPPDQMGAFLMGLAVRGETGKELLAGAKVMRENATTISLSGNVLDTCGTGGLGWTSLNTSTASAVVIAAAGGRVAKHGNRSVPPKTGSADVLEALGVSLELSEAAFRKCLDEAGVGFMFARSHHSAMRHVAPVRASLGIRTIFNLLGPLSNPASATHQILGVYHPHWLRPMAEALRDLGITKAWVVHGVEVGDKALDEISIAGPTQIIEISGGDLRKFEIDPKDYGIHEDSLDRLAGGTPHENADAISRLFDGELSPFRSAVSLNAGAGLYLLGLADTLADGIAQAAETLDNGKAMQTLQTLIAASNSGI